MLAAVDGEWQPAVMRGELFESGWGANMGYPGLVVDESGDEVPGHVLVSANLAAHWADLDEFEGEDYQRITAPATLASGERVQAHVYVLRGR